MKKVAEEKKGVVAHAKTDCEELLVEIVQDKRVADEQEKQVGEGHVTTILASNDRGSVVVWGSPLLCTGGAAAAAAESS